MSGFTPTTRNTPRRHPWSARGFCGPRWLFIFANAILVTAAAGIAWPHASPWVIVPAGVMLLRFSLLSSEAAMFVFLFAVSVIAGLQFFGPAGH